MIDRIGKELSPMSEDTGDAGDSNDTTFVNSFITDFV